MEKTSRCIIDGAMDLQVLANLAQILGAAAVVIAIVFGVVQIRQFRLQRRDAAAAELMRSFHDAQFAQALLLIMTLPNEAKADQLRAGGAAMEEAALYIGVRFETIGLLVFRGVIPFELVGELTGSIAIDLWSKMRDWALLVRKEQSRDHFLEWFHWLAEQLKKIGRHAHAPAFVQHRDWSPPRE
jgi:hypothetical protein